MATKTKKNIWSFRERVAWMPEESKAELIMELREKVKGLAGQVRELQDMLEFKAPKSKPKTRKA